MYLQQCPGEKLPKTGKTNVVSLFLAYLFCGICMREGAALIYFFKVPFCQSFKQKRCKYSHLKEYIHIFLDANLIMLK